MNLFNLHNKPESLNHYKDSLEIPSIAYGLLIDAKRKAYGYSDTGKLKQSEIDKYLPGIMKGAREVSLFAQDIIGKPFPEGEDVIATEAEPAHDYATYVLHKRWPKGEPAIIKDSHYASWYASEFRDYFPDKRWKEAEPNILKNPSHSVRYAINVLMDRWKEAEPIIMTDPEATLLYYNEVYSKVEKRGKRWKEAEPVLMDNEMIWADYMDNFI